MHVVTINEHKIAIFWTPKTGHSTMFKILTDYFSPNSKEGWRTHSEYLPSDISDFTFILLYRDPLERLVSSFISPQVPQNVCFREFISNYSIYTDHHVCPQTLGGPGINILNKSGKTFDYTINTKNLNQLPNLIEKLTGKKIQKNIRENSVNRLSEEMTEDIEYYNVKKSEFDRDKGFPIWEKFYNEKLKLMAINKLKLDFDFFKGIGIEFVYNNF